MGKAKHGKKGGKKSLSVAKRKNITNNKRGNQGLIKKDRKRERSKVNKKEKNRRIRENRKEMEELEKLEKLEVTGKEMMDMMDEDDLNTLLGTHGRKRKSTDDEDELKAREFRQYNLKTADGKDLKECLPVMTEEGWKSRIVAASSDQNSNLDLKNYKRTHINKRTSKKEDDDSGIGEFEDSEDRENETKPGEVKSVVQILAERKRYLHEQKVKMACIALNVVQDSTKLVNLNFLLKMLETNDPRADVTLYRYTLQTILQVFHDLIPGYRIQENAFVNKMKKEKLLSVKQELDFIAYYKKFLKSLEKILFDWKAEPNNLGLTAVSETTIYCLGDLLVQHPAFNYTINIIQVLMPYLNHTHEKARKLAFDSLSCIIKNDKDCFLSLQIVRQVFKFSHRQKFKVKEEVLKVLMSLRGSEMRNSDHIKLEERAHTNAVTHKEKLIRKLSEKFKQKPSRRQKKEKKKMAKLNKQMESINIEEMKNVTNGRHSEIIQKVFGLYIHVLKKRTYSKLMSVVLEGLAKFAHLVNMEFFSDLLELMNKFLEEGLLGKRESILCIQTVFTILSGQGEAININPYRFYNQFYRILMNFTTKETEENIEAILDILEQMLVLRRRRVSSAKVLSFMKRVATMSLLLPHHLAIPTLLKLKKLFSFFPISEALLESDQEGFPGIFLPEILDPEHTNSGATAVWELILGQRSYQPYVALLSTNILSGIPIREAPALHSLVEKPTLQLVQDFDEKKFNPAIPQPASHLKSIKKLKATKKLFQNGELDLEDLKLQEIFDNVLSEGDSVEEETEEPPRKKLKSIEEEDFDFFSNFRVNDNEGTDDDTVKPLEDFTSAFVDVEK